MKEWNACSFYNLEWQLPLLPTRWCYIVVTLVPLGKLFFSFESPSSTLPSPRTHIHTHTHPGVTCPTSQSRTHIQRSKEKNDNYKNNYFSPSGILLSRESNYLYLIKFMGVSWFWYYHLLENSLRYQILVLFNGSFLRKKRLIGDRLKGGDTFLSAYQITWTPFAGFFPCVTGLKNFSETYLRLLQTGS